jgi:hypothetical protein
MTTTHDEFVASNNKANLSQERFCRTSDGKKLGVWIDSENKVVRIVCDGRMISVPFEVAAWLNPTVTQLLNLAHEYGVVSDPAV